VVGWILRHSSQLKTGPPRRVKEERREGVPRKSAVSISPKGEKDVTVETTDGGHLRTHPAARRMKSGKLTPTAKVTQMAPSNAASTESAQRRTSPGPLGVRAAARRSYWYH
jgi:hypothetical protein